jgi:iron(III) transport system ATP-binding protein
MSEPALQIDGLGKAFGSHTVLDDVDLRLEAGSVTAVVGASGCGKTTLLRLIAGFDTPDRGIITIGGRTVVSGPTVFSAPTVCTAPHRRDVGYVAQDGALFPHLTVGRNVAYGLRGTLRGAALRARVDELLDMVSLDTALAGRRPHELSGGQQQRVALARALSRRPALMLLDEPFSSLDTGLRTVTRRSVSAMLAQANVTTLLVTHDQEEALSVADQVAVMRDGRFTQIGTPSQVYRSPADRYTARFLGECVLLPAIVNSAHAQCALGAIPVHDNRFHGKATVMLRPEQLTATAAAGSERPTGTGIVAASEFLGADVVLTIALDADHQPVTVRQVSIEPPAVGARVRVLVSGSAVVFGPEP